VTPSIESNDALDANVEGTPESRHVELWRDDDRAIVCSLGYITDRQLWLVAIHEGSSTVMVDRFLDLKGALLAAADWRVRLQRVPSRDDDEDDDPQGA
jgi:hypothetical protein